MSMPLITALNMTSSKTFKDNFYIDDSDVASSTSFSISYSYKLIVSHHNNFIVIIMLITNRCPLTKHG